MKKNYLKISDEEQKRIFAKNLNYYLNLNGKQQIDVAKDLEINPTTLNMWFKGNSMPGTGKIRALADYFGIGTTDLTDEKNDTDIDFIYSDIVASIGKNDEIFKNFIISYYNMPSDKKKLLCDFFEKFILK